MEKVSLTHVLNRTPYHLHRFNTQYETEFPLDSWRIRIPGRLLGICDTVFIPEFGYNGTILDIKGRFIVVLPHNLGNRPQSNLLNTKHEWQDEMVTNFGWHVLSRGIRHWRLVSVEDLPNSTSPCPSSFMVGCPHIFLKFSYSLGGTLTIKICTIPLMWRSQRKEELEERLLLLWNWSWRMS